ncbi:hypothetical protein [Leptospira sp. GIMC2001]|uniref:hypothetical protein n=1 Tax=Leptospira sp. GIMC2001 TaxID=1513297 RepID=UPI00234A64C1|nr:hypothetical protein [Leptospira sp. GIMC2001]WCL49044.1 hypothetical protein O4O04_17405 [Leptospira sp. GIMC2001]
MIPSEEPASEQLQRDTQTNSLANEDSQESHFPDSTKTGSEDANESSSSKNFATFNDGNQFTDEDLVTEPELKTLILQYNPNVMKDIIKIEKGVENFFLFNGAVYALSKAEELVYLNNETLDILASKKAIVRFQYIDYSDEIQDLILRNVVIRPVGLKADMIKKVKIACMRASALSLIMHISKRDQIIADRIKSNDLSHWIMNQYFISESGTVMDVNNPKQLPAIIKKIDNLSFESFLESRFKLFPELFVGILNILGKRSGEPYIETFSSMEVKEPAHKVIQARGGLSILVEAAPYFSFIRTAIHELASTETDSHAPKPVRSELETIVDLFGLIARNILIDILPPEQNQSIDRNSANNFPSYLEELEKHPSFSSSGGWDGAETFLTIFRSIIQKSTTLSEARNEYLIEFILKENLKSLNMKFEPVLIRYDEFNVDLTLQEILGIEKKTLFSKFLDRCKTNPELIYKLERRANHGIYGIQLLFRENLPNGFIENRKKRNLLHSMARESGIKNGIYEFLAEVPLNHPDRVRLVQEQLKLSKSISEWEKDQEEERIRKENEAKGLIKRFLEWLLSLFGIAASVSARRDDDRSDDNSSNGSKDKTYNRNPKSDKSNETVAQKKSVGVYGGPKEREISIPTAVQKAIDFVDRSNRGIIWLDDVVSAMRSSQYTLTKVSDMMFYDKQRRYIEIRALNDIRHVFIRKELESDIDWINNSIDYLDNSTSRNPEFQALSQQLKKLL